jgi:hypothetical protein
MQARAGMLASRRFASRAPMKAGDWPTVPIV